MPNSSLRPGKVPIPVSKKNVKGNFVEIRGEKFYRIRNYDEMDDFFISIVSPSDLWMYISSNGSLTAGRRNRDNALFPYYTVDKIHDFHGITGSSTLVLAWRNGKEYLWEPFLKQEEGLYTLQRNIYKNLYGNKLIFSEYNQDLELEFSYEWSNSNKFGFIKKSRLVNRDNQERKIRILDGIKNILPAGTGYTFQNEFSNLLDAYKKNELLAESGIGLFTLSSIPVDRPEPSEALYANTVFSLGIEDPVVLLSDRQHKKFKQGIVPETETDVRAARGCYSIVSEFSINPDSEKDWMIVADVNKDAARIWQLHRQILENPHLQGEINVDISKGTESLRKIISSADGMQHTDCTICTARHSSNVLYNVMRGGIFTGNYQIERTDLIAHIKKINPSLSQRRDSFIADLPALLERNDLLEKAEQYADTDLIRVIYEYLPLGFSRRHGDPSRPWNTFSLPENKEDGSFNYHYEGNWRDIFQNWEALAWSFPDYTDSMITRFLNASTMDGYNPYRITREGIDWECPDPNSPWAFIGYWGDHQIIYLQKLLEVSYRFHPSRLRKWMKKEIFVYANVPYRIRSYASILENPRETIIFDKRLSDTLKEKMESEGSDAIILRSGKNEGIYHVNLMEKILVSLLTKLCNFIPDAGIWLNTQRPEWNDANNALVGNGTSMVTVYYLERSLKFWITFLEDYAFEDFKISQEVAGLFTGVNDIFKNHQSILESGCSPEKRKSITDLLQTAHENYRNKVYNSSFSGVKEAVSAPQIQEFFDLAGKFIAATIRINKREDGLYHSYNLVYFTEDKIEIRHLYEMLEGQVAVLSSGVINSTESLQVLDALKNSGIYRRDQYSYMLYPDRELSRFMVKGRVEKEEVRRIPFLEFLLENEDESVIKEGEDKQYYFHPSFRNAQYLKEKLEELTVTYPDELSETEKNQILDLYEEVFDHKSFTGRSGTFFGYEGLGSIYWHMVSKLLLAVQECFFRAYEENADKEVLGRLTEHYYEIKAGIGLYKSPELYGAFPFDAYSHTPANSGVKQPGLTGQVKEDIIARYGELGIIVKEGQVQFLPLLLNPEELTIQKGKLDYYTLKHERRTIDLNKGSLGFTFCQVPVIYRQSEKNEIRLRLKGEMKKHLEGTTLPAEYSEMIFHRTGKIEEIEVLFSTI